MRGRRFKILHLITRLELGGAQQNTLFCTANHDRKLFEVSLISGRGGALDAEALSLDDAQVNLLPLLRHAISPLHDLLAFCQLFRMLRRGRFDIVHTHSSKAGILGRWAAFLAGVPVILHTVHGWSFNATQSPWSRWLYLGLERLTAQITDRLIVVASADGERGLALGIGNRDQYALVRSGIDVNAFGRPALSRDEMRASLGYAAEHIVVGTVACLKAQKAPLDFVRTAAGVCAENDRVRFFIAGDGPLRPQVEQLIDELGLQDKVVLLGWRRDVVELLHAMDIFLLTSLFEGLPRAILQAMAAGVAVVATAVDGTPEVVEDRATGLLIPAGVPSDAAVRVLELAGDAPLRHALSDAARKRLSIEFEITQMVQTLEALYLEARDGGHC